MPEVRKVLGQATPGAVATTLYTVPAGTQAVVSTLSVANLSATDRTFRIAVRPAGATLANIHYLAYDAPIKANDSLYLTLGLTLGSTDVVTVYGSTDNVAFSLFGVEVS